MKRRQFIQKTALTTVGASALVSASAKNSASEMEEQQQMYELRVYTLRFFGSKAPLHEYLQSALIPALNRHGVGNVGVFGEVADPNPTKLYVLIPYNSAQHMLEVGSKLSEDTEYLKGAATYDKVPVDKAIYTRYETSILQAFSGLPVMRIPDSKERIFELRTYEGYSEDAVRRKVKMFNEGEIEIFDKTKLNSVFFGHIMAGPGMPALIYMLWFKNMEERDSNWKDFISHPDWKAMSGKEEYANTVSNILRVFLKPLDYSQV